MKSEEKINHINIKVSGKKVISDIVTAPKKNTLAREKVSSHSSLAPERQSERPSLQNESVALHIPGSSRRSKKGVYWLCSGLIFLWVLFGIFTAKMEVGLMPKRLSLKVDKVLTLSKDSAEKSDFHFRTMAVNDEREKVFKATESKSQAERASGTVIMFNKNKDAQVLIASTRLESTEGKIYRIPQAVVVPGAKSSGKDLVPGSKEVVVYADKAGSEYNIGLTDFTLPGFQGLPKFNLVFARSKTEISGGSNGGQIVVGKKDAESALAELSDEAKKAALKILLSKLPEEEFLLPDTLEYAPIKEIAMPSLGEAALDFKFNVKGELRAATVPRKELEAILIASRADLADISPAGIVDLESLSFKTQDYKFGEETMKLHVVGQYIVEHKIDIDMMKNRLLESEISDGSAILGMFSGIERATVKFKPFWVRFVPFKMGRIDIVLEQR